MSEIEVGDLVYVAKPQPCCGAGNWLGVTFTVGSLRAPTPVGGGASPLCVSCRIRVNGWLVTRADGEGEYLLETLKKFRPMDELERLDAERPIREPA